MSDITILFIHTDGIPWYKAPIPKRFHRCTAQTKAFDRGEIVLRCACGSIAFKDAGRKPYWMKKNARLKALKAINHE